MLGTTDIAETPGNEHVTSLIPHKENLPYFLFLKAQSAPKNTPKALGTTLNAHLNRAMVEYVMRRFSREAFEMFCADLEGFTD